MESRNRGFGVREYVFESTCLIRAVTSASSAGLPVKAAIPDRISAWLKDLNSWICLLIEI